MKLNNLNKNTKPNSFTKTKFRHIRNKYRAQKLLMKNKMK